MHTYKMCSIGSKASADTCGFTHKVAVDTDASGYKVADTYASIHNVAADTDASGHTTWLQTLMH